MKKHIGLTIFIVLLVIVIAALAFIQFTNKTDIPKQQTNEVQNDLAKNCARDIPREKIDDSLFNSEQKTVTVYWWDNELQNNVSLVLPYEPETDFAGCSESVKEFLRHIRDTVEEKR